MSNDAAGTTEEKRSKFDTLEIAPHSKNYGKGSTRDRLDTRDFNLAMVDEKDEDGGLKTDEDEDEEQQHLVKPEREKFGTLDGVLGRCLLCMWGVIMFLRTGWIVGQSGIWQTTLVMLVSASVTFFTTLSLSAICTNGQVEGGGPYFFISRSLGPQWGGVVGILFAFANCIGVSLHLAGFGEAVVDIYKDKGVGMTPNASFDLQIIGIISLIFLVAVAYRGVGSIIKFNLFLLFLMFISIIAFFIGTFTTKKDPVSLGYTGYSGKTFKSNWNPAYRGGETFLSMISIFFPSVTGCMAGANISGDLKNPARNIPVGTLAAVIFSMAIYVIIAWMLGATVLRDSEDGTGGLYNNYLIMSDLSIWRPLVDMGIYASTFSSATSCFVAAPRILQAVCEDGLFPRLKYFGKGRDKDNEPLRCYSIVVVLALGFLLSGDINFVAPMVTNFFLITYAMVNYSVFAWDVTKSPGWRPTFKYYSKWISLFATLQCVVLMFLINWYVSLITFIVGAIIYKYVEYVDPDVHWGTTLEAMIYKNTCKSVLKYQLIKPHAKVDRPTFLILNTETTNLNELYNIAKVLNYAQGLIIIGDVIIGDYEDKEILNKFVTRKNSTIKLPHLSDEINKQCIIESVVAKTFQIGMRNIFQLAGVGPLKPNVILLKMEDTYQAIHNAKSTASLTNIGYNKSNSENDNNAIEDENEVKKEENEPPIWFSTIKDSLNCGQGIVMLKYPDKKNFNLTFARTDKHVIDVWWLYDDGGMTILLAYLLSKNKLFEKAKLRIMSLTSMGIKDKIELAKFVDKLRINADIHVIGESGDIQETLTEQIINDSQGRDASYKMDSLHEHMAKKSNALLPLLDKIKSQKKDEFRAPDKVTYDNVEYNVSDFAKAKIRNYKKIAKIIGKQSSDSELILITMPFPRIQYKWWEYHLLCDSIIEKVNAPIAFVRGNQQQVLVTDF